MSRGRKKQEPIIENGIKNCCIWKNSKSYCDADKIHLCCSFCPKIDCQYRCFDYKDGCINLTTEEFHHVDPYENYKEIIKTKKKTKKEIKKVEEPIKTEAIEPQETTKKRGRGRPPKERRE